VPGISRSPDKMLQARIFSYADAHRYRVGVRLKRNRCNQSNKTKVIATWMDTLPFVSGCSLSEPSAPAVETSLGVRLMN
jgi:hypothetical protein